MKRFTIAVGTLLWVSVCLGAAPQVVETSPEDGAKDVDPALEEIRIVFDQPMQPGYSFMRDEAGFPDVIGKVSWVDDRTCVLPVLLRAGTEYALGINTGSGSGFHAVAGPEASPFRLRFRTAGKASTPEDRSGLVVDHLQRLIRDQYSYRDRVVRDWDALFAKHRSALLEAPGAEAFAAEAAKLLAAADDQHIWLQTAERRIGTRSGGFERNFDLAGIRNVVPNLQRRNRTVSSGRFEDGIGYMLIQSWARNRAADLAVLDEILNEMDQAPGLIVDLRANGGGDETLARRFAGRFVAQPVVYAQSVQRDPYAKSGWAKPVERTLRPREKEAKRFTGRLVVLQGPFTMSSAEASVLMLASIPGSTTVGASTFGASGNPRGHDLGNGVTVHLPSWKAMDAQGRVFEGVGIPPDVEVPASLKQLAEGDPIIAKALALLRTEAEPQRDGSD